jgi:cob(I)alamin adenosyltransferase
MSRVSKLHPRVEAYGTIDELNAQVGVALLAEGMPARFAEWLSRVQNDLLDVGADLSVPLSEDEERERLRVTSEYTAWLEQACDVVNEKLPPLRSFVIPGGRPRRRTCTYAALSAAARSAARSPSRTRTRRPSVT